LSPSNKSYQTKNYQEKRKMSGLSDLACNTLTAKNVNSSNVNGLPAPISQTFEAVLYDGAIASPITPKTTVLTLLLQRNGNTVTITLPPFQCTAATSGAGMSLQTGGINGSLLLPTNYLPTNSAGTPIDFQGAIMMSLNDTTTGGPGFALSGPCVIWITAGGQIAIGNGYNGNVDATPPPGGIPFVGIGYSSGTPKLAAASSVTYNNFAPLV
jgi:hypothetical protein